MAQYRMERLGHEIRQKIGALILEGKIKDNRINPFLSITKANVARDLSYADVYVSDIRGKNIERGVEGLQSAAGFIQSQLNKTMRLRKIPLLRFHSDPSISGSFEMIKKLEELVQTENINKTSDD